MNISDDINSIRAHLTNALKMCGDIVSREQLLLIRAHLTGANERIDLALHSSDDKPEPRREIPDERFPGLYLIVQPSGKKSWALRFRSPVERDERGFRKAKKLTLGTFAPETVNDLPKIGDALTTEQARVFAETALVAIKRGIDPTHIRRMEKENTRRVRKASSHIC